MDKRQWMVRCRFWSLALLWLPAGMVAQTTVRLGASAGAFADPGQAMAAMGSLALLSPCGVPLALGCRRLWCLGYRRGAWTAGIGTGAVTTPATAFAGLLGPPVPWANALKSCRLKVKARDEHINETDRAVRSNVVVHSVRKQQKLGAIFTKYVRHDTFYRPHRLETPRHTRHL